jgi:hypothetical protein
MGRATRLEGPPRHDGTSHADVFMTFACSGVAEAERRSDTAHDRYRQAYRGYDGLTWMAG